jgi:hypothetical protein
MWILIITFATANFTVVVDSQDACVNYMRANSEYWQATGQRPIAICMPTLRT